MIPAEDIARGTLRLLAHMNYRGVTELPLTNNRRCDIAALGPRGEITIIEVKSSRTDFLTDRKWPEYLDHCERFYFAVAPDFPTDILPKDQGLIIADGYGGEMVRDAEPRKLAPARRKSITLRMARASMQRLQMETDPTFDQRVASI